MSAKLTRTEAKKCSMMFESQQEAFLMAVLNRYGFIFITKRPRKTSDSNQYLQILRMTNEKSEEIDFQERIKQLIVMKDKEISDEEKNKKKYEKRNEVAATACILIAELSRLGWTMSFEKSKECSKTLKMERIVTMKNGSVCFTKEEIAECGKRINTNVKNAMTGLDKKIDIQIGYDLLHDVCLDVMNNLNATDNVVAQTDIPSVTNTMSINGMNTPSVYDTYTVNYDDGLPPMPLNVEYFVVDNATMDTMTVDNDYMDYTMVNNYPDYTSFSGFQ